MKVLSLFDGISCGRIAFERAGIPVSKYYASEIDKYATTISENNYPDIIRLGDVTKWREWDIEIPDIIIAGSPCQGFSFAGKQLNFRDPRSALFFEFVNILNHFKAKNPDIKFLLENVKMKKEYQDTISKLLGCEQISINSNLVSAQDRDRNYWTNISEVEIPENRGIFLKHIWDGGVDITERLYAKKKGTLAYSKGWGALRKLKDRSRCLLTGGQGISNSGATNISINGRFYKPSCITSERLQTLPDCYTVGVSNTQRHKAIGNGWTVDVIAHIFKNLK